MVEEVVPTVRTQLIDPPGLVPVATRIGCTMEMKTLFPVPDVTMDPVSPVSAYPEDELSVSVE